MPILYTRALSREDADAWARGHHRDAKSVHDAFDGRVAWIGITNPGVPSPLRAYRGPKLILNFHDYEFSLCINTAEQRELVQQQGPQKSHAQEIHAFLERFARHEESWAVLAHCHQGVSRSGAVATWTQERYKVMSPLIFPKLHSKKLDPNVRLIELLEEVVAEEAASRDPSGTRGA